MARTFNPSEYFQIGKVWMESAFQQFFDNQKSDWPTLMYYYDKMTDEQKKSFFTTMSDVYQKTSIRDLMYSLHPHVKAWNKSHTTELNEMFKKALKRKRSMEGDVTLIVRWMNIIPDSSDWKEYLKGDLPTWDTVPNKYCDPSDLQEIMQFLGQDHPKYNKLMAYYIDRLNKSDASTETFHAFFEKHYALIVATDDTNDQYDNMRHWLVKEPQRVVNVWHNLTPKWQKLVIHAMMHNAPTDVFIDCLESNMYPDAMKNILMRYPDAMSFYDRHIVEKIYDRYFAKNTDELSSKSIHLIYKMIRTNDDVLKAHFLVNLMFENNLPRVKRSYSQSEEFVDFVAYGIEYISQQSLGWIALYLILTICSKSSRWVNTSVLEPVQDIRIYHSERMMLAQLLERYPVLERLLVSFQRSKDSNIMLDVLSAISFDSAEEQEHIEQNANLILGTNIYTFNEELTELLRVSLVKQDGKFYLNKLETTRKHRSVGKETWPLFVKFVDDINPLLTQKMTDLSNIEEFDLM